MLKEHRIIRQIGDVLDAASTTVSQRILESYSDLSGREEDITPQIRSEITFHLLEEIRSRLDEENIGAVKFRVHTFNKKEENKVGADLAGVVEINLEENGGRKMSKAYLAQAKIAKASLTENGEIHIRCSNPLILKQATDMLRITSDSFFFLYTSLGIFVVPALEVGLIGKNSIDTKDYYFKSFGDFYEEMFKCFVGDHKIALIYDSPSDLEEYALSTNTSNVLYINATVP